MDGPVVFHLDPGQRGFIELIKSQVSDTFEHRQQTSLDPVPKALLLAILKRRIGQCFFVYDTQSCQALRCFSRERWSHELRSPRPSRYACPCSSLPAVLAPTSSLPSARFG